MEIKKNLEELPETIRKKEMDLLQIKYDIEAIKKTIKDQEINVAQEVLNLSNQEEHKKELSNDAKRKIKTQELLNGSEGYKLLVQSVIEKEQDAQIKAIELDFIKRCFRATESLVRLEK